MTNAERLLLLKRARLELQRVRDGIEIVATHCPRCDEEYVLDQGALALDRDLDAMAASVSSWIDRLSRRSLSSERVSPETRPGAAHVTSNGTRT